MRLPADPRERLGEDGKPAVIALARMITHENAPQPHGPFREIDLEKATHLGIHSRRDAPRGTRNTLLACFGRETYQVRNKDNRDNRRELLSLRETVPTPWPPIDTRWTARGLNQEHASFLFQAFQQRFIKLLHMGDNIKAWLEYLEQKGIKRTPATHDSLDHAMNIPDPISRKHSILLTRDQTDRILVLGLP